MDLSKFIVVDATKESGGDSTYLHFGVTVKKDNPKAEIIRSALAKLAQMGVKPASAILACAQAIAAGELEF